MSVHKNARLTPRGREILILRLERGEHRSDVATAMGVSASTVYKWRRRHRADRHRGQPVARNRRTDPDPPRPQLLARPGAGQPARRYERERPCELIHIDIKKSRPLRQGQPSHRRRSHRTKQQPRRRLGVRPCLHRRSLPPRLRRRHARRKIGKRNSLPENRHRLVRQPRNHRRTGHDRDGSCYRSRSFRVAGDALHLRHVSTKPYRPKTNGKAKRFIQSSLREWAYARAYETSSQRPPNSPTGCMFKIGMGLTPA